MAHEAREGGMGSMDVQCSAIFKASAQPVHRAHKHSSVSATCKRVDHAHFSPDNCCHQFRELGNLYSLTMGALHCLLIAHEQVDGEGRAAHHRQPVPGQPDLGLHQRGDRPAGHCHRAPRVLPRARSR